MNIEDETLEDIIVSITVIFFVSVLIILVIFFNIRNYSVNKKEFVNYCKIHKDIKIVDKSYTKKNYVIRRNFIYLIHQYRIKEEDENVKDIKLYFNNKIVYNLRELPSNYFSDNKITDCSEFYDNYVEGRER